MTTLPSGMRPETLPAVPATRPLSSISWAAASTASWVGRAHVEHLRVGAVDGALAGEQAGDVVGHQRRVVRLGVVGGAPDVRRQHDVGHGLQRVVGRQVLALEVVEPGAAEVARRQRGGQGVDVVEGGPGRVQVDRARLHAGELVGADQADRVGRDHGVHRDDVGLGQQVVELVGGGVVEGVVGDDLHAQALEAPGRGPPDRAEADDAHGPARELPGPVALVGDRAAVVDRARCARPGRRGRCPG